MDNSTCTTCSVCGGTGRIKPSPESSAASVFSFDIETDLSSYLIAREDDPCPACQPPFPKTGVDYDITFAVDFTGQGWLVSAAVEVHTLMKEIGAGPNLDDCCFEKYPEEAGFYQAKARYQFYPGFGEDDSDYGFRLSDIVKL